jgi:hypothetical protein
MRARQLILVAFIVLAACCGAAESESSIGLQLGFGALSLGALGLGALGFTLIHKESSSHPPANPTTAETAEAIEMALDSLPQPAGIQHNEDIETIVAGE